MWYPKNKYAALAWMMMNERRARADIDALQSSRLRELVCGAYENVPFYRDLYDAVGLQPGDVRTIADLRLLPTVSKRDFHEREPIDYLDQRNADKASLTSIKTSGSSGLALEIFIDGDYDQLRKAQYLRPYLTNGRRLTDHVLRFCSEASPPRRWFHQFRLLRESFVYADSNVEAHIERIRAERPDVIQGFGSELFLIGQAILSAGIEVPRPRLVFTDSELLTPTFRNVIEQAFGTDVIDVYGTYEAGNTAYECAEHAGYHLAEDCVITEFLDARGEPVGPDQEGELAFTALHGRAMPLIRYRVGDMGSYTSQPCPCGRTSKRMTTVLGRMTDFALCRDGRRKSPTAFMGAFDQLVDRLYELQVVQTDIDAFEIRVIPRQALGTDFERSLKAALAAEFPGASVQVNAVTSIPRLPSGKFKAFVQACET